jgi:hypothetical protein
MAILAALPLAYALPVEYLMYLPLVASFSFRIVDPTNSTIVSYIPDLLLLLFIVRVAMDLALGKAVQYSGAPRRLAAPLAAFCFLALASTLINGDTPIALISSLRQFGRFPLWAVASLLSGVTGTQGRRILKVVLAMSLLQLPFAFYQYVHGNPYTHTPEFDRVTGTFGEGGGGPMMIFLVGASVVWLSLAVSRSIRLWVLLGVVPALILPMAWGSAVAFLLLLPLAVFTLLTRAAVSKKTRLTLLHVVGASLLVLLGGWAAQSFSVASDVARPGNIAGTDILRTGYLSRYLETTAAQQSSRPGFLEFAIRTNASGGPRTIAFGQGPSASIIGPAAKAGTKVSLSRFAAKSSHSVWSLQRILLGYGFLATAIYVFLIAGGAFRFGKLTDPEDRTAQALSLALPIAGGIALFGGVYTSGWADPAAAAGFWAIVVATHATLQTSPATL